MANQFYIKKQSGTYSETLEAFGVANLLYEILQRNNTKGFKVILKDLEHSYLVETNKDVTEEMINNLAYFQIIKFIKKEITTPIPEGINDYFDYPANKAIQDEYKKRYKEIEKIKPDEAKKKAKKALTEERLSEFGKRVDAEFDVYREIKGNPYASFCKLFENFHEIKEQFPQLLNAVLANYSASMISTSDITISEKKPTAQQLYNPNQGKGLNKNKANNVSMGNLDGNWISETMKISGALSFMICQLVKVGSSYDLKISVPEFNEMQISEAREILFEFKRYLKSTSPIKLDVLNSLGLAINFIKHTPEYKGKVRKTLKGFYSVYQKDLGQNKAVANIAFVNIPDFVEYNNEDEAHVWVEILEHQRNLISNIDERGDSIQGLQNYRNFLGSIGKTAVEYFSSFSYWYAGYVMQQLTKGNNYVRTFKKEYLNKFYKNMDTKELNLTEIIQNDGFKAVANAIRKSTVTLQYTPKDQRKFEIRYGLAQQLQNKAKAKEDLATFIGEFIGTYNSETARNAEKNEGKAFRTNVKDEELMAFYSLLDKNPARLIGALLSSYGFALNKKETPKDEEQDNQNDEIDN